MTNIKQWKLTNIYRVAQSNLANIAKRKSIRFGLPFLLFVLGGSFGLKEWTQIRYQFSQVKGVSKEEAKKMGLNKANDITLEKVYDDIQKLDIDNWENKRGPRPWETNTALEHNKK